MSLFLFNIFGSYWEAVSLTKTYASSILVDAFNPAQSARYDLYKRSKLRKETLRRIVNHALSQSVPASVVTTINGFTKVFAGEIIEKARTVQEEWAEAFDRQALEEFERQQAEAELRALLATGTAHADQPSSSPTIPEALATQRANSANGFKEESPTTPEVIPSQLSPSVEYPVPDSVTSLLDGIVSTAAEEDTITFGLSSLPEFSTNRDFQRPPNPHRGQLLPSHLREALRRYQRESGHAGTSGLSMLNLGVRGSHTWNIGVGGQRLFR
jgi:transcription initiation factor TFIID subunit 11